jgi:hypothetical protein
MLTPQQVLNSSFLETRSQLVEIAATLDRYDRAVEAGLGPANDPRLAKIYRSLELLADRRSSADRSERLLLLFSDLDN